MQPLPGLGLIQRAAKHYSVHTSQLANDGGTVVLVDYRVFVFIFTHQLVAVHADNQNVTKLSCLVQEIQVAYMEHIECSLCIPNIILFHQ